MPDPKSEISSWCRDGDQAGFRRFYEMQSPRLWKYLVARGCAPDAAYDVLADAFLRFIQVVCRDPKEPVALLYRIATNLRIDAYRREQSAATDFLESFDDVPAPPAGPFDWTQLQVLIKDLSESEQNLLLLRYGIGLSHKETAQVMGLPEGTVRRQCAAALGKLRERGQEMGDRNAGG